MAILLAFSLSVVLVWQILRASVADALIRTNPFAVAQIAPGDPRVPFSLAMLEFRAAGGAIRAETREQAMKAMARAPLAYEPFFLAGLDALTRRDEAGAQRLLLEARRRNPRSRYARLLLLDGHLRAGRIDEATVEMGALGNLIPDAGGLLTAELARMAQSPATERALAQALRRHPGPRDGVLEHLAQSGADPDLVLRLARAVPAPAGAQQGAPWQAKLINSLVASGQIERAHGLWREFSSPRAPKRFTGIYDPAMRGLPGLAPFNWSFPASAAGAAERSPAGLQAEYYGRDGVELASQLLMLPPGRFRLSFIAEGSADGASSRLGWKLTCLQSKTELGELILKNVDHSPGRISGEFAIPREGCSAQWLKLVGTPSEFAKPQSATIRNLEMRAVG